MSGESYGSRYRVTSHSPECSVHHLAINAHGGQQVERLTGASSRNESMSATATTNQIPNVIRWSSSERALTPSECLQLQVPTTVYGTARSLSADSQQGQLTEHRMVLDGSDAYTLVIVDCSPRHDAELECSMANNSSGGTTTCRACDCASRCGCQTELIVKQQMVAHHHHHNHDQTCQQQQLQQQRLAAIDERSHSSQLRESEIQHERQQQQQQSHYQQLNRNQNQNQYQYQNQQQQHSHSQQQAYQQSQPQQQQQIIYQDRLSPQQLQRQQYYASPSPIQQHEPQQQQQAHISHQYGPNVAQEQQQHHQKQSQPQQQQPNLQPPQQQPHQPKSGTRLVKRWNWNQAQFVETEVADQPAQRPQFGPPQARSSSTDVWHQEVIMPSTSQKLQSERQTTSQQQPEAGQQSESPQPRQYDPSWLAYRKPDMEAVQSDPLYRDLMLELQKLEEGVEVQPPEPISEPETFQRPVFGQHITPESIETKEYENVEFVCRVIPISDPSMKVEWTVNGKPLQESSRYTSEHEFGVIRLRIKRCEAEDSGIYQCRASNSLGEAYSTASLRVHAKGNVQCETLNPAGLDKIRQLENPKPVDRVEEQLIEQPPKFLTHITDYVEKEEGDSVHFECCLGPVDDPDLKTEWFFNGRSLVTGSRFHTIDDFGFIVLDIDWLFPRDTGEYVCRATNKHGSDITRTVLRVKPAKNIILDSQLENPQVIEKLHQLEFPDVVQETFQEEPDRPAHFVQPLRSEGNKRQFVEGDNVHFEARVGPATDGNLTVEWFHNDKPLMDGHRFKPTFDFGHIQLDILYVYAEDSGVYKCITRNATGTDVSQFEIRVTGKPSLVYQSQLPKEMVGGVQKITDMEAMWNRAPDPEEEEAPAQRLAPEFTLKPKPCVAFEGSCARFCCRVVANPRPRLNWTLNGQTVVSGSRHKLTYDGMYHLIIPKCQLGDAGKVEVHARNPLGECFATTELKVRRKVDDYRSVLKNSPNPWYDEQSLKVYQRQRSQDLTDDDDYGTFLQQYLSRHQQQQNQSFQYATEQQSSSPMGNQVIGYMEPGTPDVNLLMRTQSPLVEPGDLHPVVVEQQVVMAPAPSTIGRALEKRSTMKAPEAKHFYHQRQQASTSGQTDLSSSEAPNSKQRIFGLDLPRYSSQQQQQLAAGSGRSSRQQDLYNSDSSQQQQAMFDPRLPPPSPESVVHGKEVHSHTHKQTQLERRPNREIVREIVEREIFEQEHKGVTKESVVRGSSAERGSTPSDSVRSETDEQHRKQQVQRQRQVHFQVQQQQQIEQQHQVLIDDNMVPPEFIQKIQPCQAIDGDEVRFECTFKGEPKPTISWFRESKMIKPSNLYSITTDLDANKSVLRIRRVTLNGNAVYTVKAENAAGSAKSSANLVVEAHPLPEASKGGLARQVDGHPAPQDAQSATTTTTVTTTTVGTSSLGSQQEASVDQRGLDSAEQSQSDSIGSQGKVVKSIKSRKISADQLAALIRASPEGLVAPTFLHTIHALTSKPGELARLDARILGSQPMEVRWLKDGQRIRADKGHKLVLEGDLYTLLILECSQRDEGLYECIATNRVGEARCEARLHVSDQRGATPEVVLGGSSSSSSSVSRMTTSATTTTTTTSMSSKGSAGQQIALPMTTTSGGASSSSSSQQLAAGERKHFGLTKHQSSPLMDHYTAQQQQQQRQQPEAPKLIKRLENQQVREGKSVTLRCQISSFPPIAEVHWFKQGDKLIKPSKYFRIFKDNDETYCLKILETFPEDQGEYKCVARAPNGQTQVETKATISVIPNSPR